jgi:hypothetical protein
MASANVADDLEREIILGRLREAGKRHGERPSVRRASRHQVAAAEHLLASPRAHATAKAGNPRPAKSRAIAGDARSTPSRAVADARPAPTAVAVATPTSVAVTAPAQTSTVIGSAVVAWCVAVGARCVAVIAVTTRCGVTVAAGAPAPTAPTERRSRSAFKGKERCCHRQGDDKCPHAHLITPIRHSPL